MVIIMDDYNIHGANIAGKYKEIRLTKDEACIILNALQLKLNDYMKKSHNKAFTKNKITRYNNKVLEITSIMKRLGEKFGE